MTTVINNPGGESTGDSGAGIIIGVIVAIVLIALFIIYGIPALRSNSSQDNTQPGTTNVNVTVPPATPAAPKSY